jgi:hypothetical protein
MTSGGNFHLARIAIRIAQLPIEGQARLASTEMSMTALGAAEMERSPESPVRMVDDAVCCRELQGNNRGISCFSGPILSLRTADKAAQMLGLFTKFPGEWNRELFSLIREFKNGIREFSGRSRETHLVSGRGANPPRFPCG